MNAEGSLGLLRDIKDVAFATVDKHGKPQVRIIDIMLVEENKIYFATARGKDFYQQITLSSTVAITGLTKDYEMIRVQGNVNKVGNQKCWIDKIFDHNPSMKDIYPKNSRYILEAFYVDDMEIEYFNLGTNPIFRENYHTGKTVIYKKGFMITNICISCGKCAKNCPQQCILKKEIYEIQQNHCLHCGLCLENCPVQAIEKLEENNK